MKLNHDQIDFPRRLRPVQQLCLIHVPCCLSSSPGWVSISVWEQTGSTRLYLSHSGTHASTGCNLICCTYSLSPPVFTTSTDCECYTIFKPQRTDELLNVYLAHVNTPSAGAFHNYYKCEQLILSSQCKWDININAVPL